MIWLLLAVVAGILIWVLFSDRRSTFQSEWEVLKAHKYWNTALKRVMLPDFEIAKLPFKMITREEFFKFSSTPSFNPVFLYKHLIQTEILEAGYDLEYRYLIDFKKEVTKT